MKNIGRLALAGALLVGTTAVATTSIVRASQDEVDMAAMMEQMMKLATPGEEHAHLAALAGEWEQHYRMRMAPDAEWMESKGTSTARTLLDGRYIMDEVTFEVMGAPTKGVHIIGYDNMNEEYISFWADSWSTWWVTARGKQQEDGAIETTGEMNDVAGKRPFRMRITHREDGTMFSEMFDTIPGHGEIKVMEITAKRR